VYEIIGGNGCFAVERYPTKHLTGLGVIHPNFSSSDEKLTKAFKLELACALNKYLFYHSVGPL
jgi:hypothetical protein